MKRIKRLTCEFALASGLLLGPVPYGTAQTESSLTIRVESNQVLVPAFVFDKQRWDDDRGTPTENRCIWESAKALQEKGISVRQTPSCWGGSMLGLASRDFRLFEDGAEQTIQSITRQRSHWWQLYDNYGVHREYSGTPRGKWSTSDFGSTDWAPPGDIGSYLIAYAPPQSAKGSCHQIRISVDRRNVVVFNRSQYCNVQHSPSDPLEGTKLDQQMEADLASPAKPKIPMLATSGVFFEDTGATQVHLVLDFPWRSLHREWLDGYGHLFATIGVLGIAYRKDGTPVMRFSDQACCPRDGPPWPYGSEGPGGDAYAIPARYETQMRLAPGDYDLRVILSDGKKFGRLDIPLNVQDYDQNQLALSSVALCKRYHRVDPPSYTEGILPPKFLRLVSKGTEFTPTADPTFGKRDPLFAYFEVHAPELRTALSAAGAASASVRFQLRITNLATGKVQIDSGLRPTPEFLQSAPAEPSPPSIGASSADFLQQAAPSSPPAAPGAANILHIVQEIATHDLPKGNYRLEVQASDSAGNRTPWHAATFTIR